MVFCILLAILWDLVEKWVRFADFSWDWGRFVPMGGVSGYAGGRFSPV